MAYPCIVYSISKIPTTFANNKPYNHQTGYQLIIMDRNPNSLLMSKIAELPMCVFERHYTKDNLNHYVYNLYY